MKIYNLHYFFQFKSSYIISFFIIYIINKILTTYPSLRNKLSYNEGWYKDYYISTTEVSKVPAKYYSKGIMIDVYDKYGNYIETLNTTKEVREKYNIPSNKLKNIQMGDKYYKDYIFKYHTNK